MPAYGGATANLALVIDAHDRAWPAVRSLPGVIGLVSIVVRGAQRSIRRRRSRPVASRGLIEAAVRRAAGGICPGGVRPWRQRIRMPKVSEIGLRDAA